MTYNKILISFLILIFLTACSSICLVPKQKGADSVTIYELDLMKENDDQFHRKLRKDCTKRSSFSYWQGNILADAVRLFTFNDSPACAFKKAKNSASKISNSFVITISGGHFEAGHYFIAAVYTCPKNADLKNLNDKKSN